MQYTTSISITSPAIHILN
uniref:Uncharacterized protein n=1 Tax=Anguilla anguilla TaxID=7936 RepID=A0A0E9VXT7_ANGAN